MDINGWLTIIAVFTAIFTFIPREDLKLSLLKIYRIEKWLIILSVIALIPFLILFPKLVEHWKCLKVFYINQGFEPSNIAFILFYTSFLWLIARLFWLKSTTKINDSIIDYYYELLSEKPFDEFFKLFTKNNKQIYKLVKQ